MSRTITYARASRLASLWKEFDFKFFIFNEDVSLFITILLQSKVVFLTPFIVKDNVMMIKNDNKYGEVCGHVTSFISELRLRCQQNLKSAIDCSPILGCMVYGLAEKN